MIFHSYIKLPEGIIFLWATKGWPWSWEYHPKHLFLNHHVHWIWVEIIEPSSCRRICDPWSFAGLWHRRRAGDIMTRPFLSSDVFLYTIIYIECPMYGDIPLLQFIIYIDHQCMVCLPTCTPKHRIFSVHMAWIVSDTSPSTEVVAQPKLCRASAHLVAGEQLISCGFLSSQS